MKKFGTKKHNRIYQNIGKYGIIMVDKIKKEEKAKESKKRQKIGCPVCGDTENLAVTGRCVTCLSCGWSKCSL